MAFLLTFSVKPSSHRPPDLVWIRHICNRMFEGCASARSGKLDPSRGCVHPTFSRRMSAVAHQDAQCTMSGAIPHRAVTASPYPTPTPSTSSSLNRMPSKSNEQTFRNRCGPQSSIGRRALIPRPSNTWNVCKPIIEGFQTPWYKSHV